MKTIKKYTVSVAFILILVVLVTASFIKLEKPFNYVISCLFAVSYPVVLIKDYRRWLGHKKPEKDIVYWAAFVILFLTAWLAIFIRQVVSISPPLAALMGFIPVLLACGCYQFFVYRR